MFFAKERVIFMKFQWRKQFPLWSVLFLSAGLNIWNLWEEGFANLYYSAGVYSMGQSFHAFFFNSLDSAGFISIDKPPLGLWIQVLFTKVFGFSGVVLLLPQAIAGVLSVYFLYRIIDRRFGQAAGITSALVLALTPIFVAVSRNNSMDGILILLLVLASGQVIKAAEESSMKHLILSCLFIGLGFNVKMLQSFMIVPAVFITYFLFSGKSVRSRITPAPEAGVASMEKSRIHPLMIKILSCLSALLILLAVSFSWIAAVDLTPSQDRPYVGSSGDNSALSLALGYNGINRLLGKNSIVPDNGGTAQDDIRPVPPDNGTEKPVGGEPVPPDNRSASVPEGEGPVPQGGGPASEGGSPSVLRLYNSQMAGQVSWFLFPALLASLLILFRLARAVIRKGAWKAFREEPKNIAFTYFAMCFIPMLLYFSFSSGLVHRYYLAMLGFPIAAMVGIGFSILLEKIKTGGRKPAFITLAVFAVTAILQLYIQSLYTGWLPLLLPVSAGLFAIAAVGMIAAILLKKPGRGLPLLLVLLILPGVWSFTPILYGDNAQLPITGPELKEESNAFSSMSDLTELVLYLKENKGDAEYIASVPSAMQLGAELILQSGEPVMVLGGFNGSDNPITLEEYKAMIRSGKICYAIVTSGGSAKASSVSPISDWIVQHGEAVDIDIGGFTLYKLGLD
jgi:4-amino-4-deoxy-L-arabinose transferase-like glycosyltransferase